MPTPLPAPPFTESAIPMVAAEAKLLVPKAGTEKLTLYFDANPGVISLGAAAVAASEGAPIPADKAAPVQADAYFEVIVKGSPILVEMPAGGTLRVIGER